MEMHVQNRHLFSYVHLFMYLCPPISHHVHFFQVNNLIAHIMGCSGVLPEDIISLQCSICD